MPKTLRLVALGPSCAEATWKASEGVQTWGIQYTWRNFKLDRAFVMDDEEWIKAKNSSFSVPIDIAKEMRECGVPIYVAKKWSDVPNTIEYPIKEVLEYFKPLEYFMNSIAYMFALAIMEGYQRIETYGVDFRYFGDLGNDLKYPPNWLDETHCGTFWAGVAIGRGIEVITTKRSSLMKPVRPKDPSLYGYEVSPLIVEQRKVILEKRKKVEQKKEPDSFNVFRPPKGVDLKEFLRSVELGEVRPIANVEATMVDEVYGDAKAVEIAFETVGDNPTSIGNGSSS